MTQSATAGALATVIAVVLLSTAPSCMYAQHTEARNATVPIDGASHIEIRARAGYLKVVGRSGLTSVAISSTARASSRDLLSEVRLVAERRGNVIHIEALMPDLSSRGFFFGLGNRWSALDLDIMVPAGAVVVADDGSGDAEFSGTGDLRVSDGSGHLSIRDVLGEVDVRDGSGDLTVENAVGPVTIRDGSGAIRMEGVGRDITIRDGSGEIVLRRVATVVVESDGSGGISVTDATGSVTVKSDGAGHITVANVAGDFVVERGGSGRIDHQNVRGRVSVPSRR